MSVCNVDLVIPTTYVEGDQRPDLCLRHRGIDLSSHNAIKLRIQRPDGSLLVKVAQDVVFDGTDSTFEFKWDPGDFIAGNSQPAELVFTDSGNKDLTVGVLYLNVRPRLAGAAPTP